MDPRPESHDRGHLVETRDRRRGKLHQLRDTEPAHLIAMYRKIAALDEEMPLPAGVNFVSIVEAILDHEIAHGTPLDEPL